MRISSTKKKKRKKLANADKRVIKWHLKPKWEECFISVKQKITFVFQLSNKATAAERWRNAGRQKRERRRGRANESFNSRRGRGFTIRNTREK
ncbi:hypothetical protein PUN28_009193 [Cardiocondyla obscurior]|uniref:Uncharacterized protein n=1 Tax=Cardiocondyla obscurior TaxID=286306 RepID=A0AAW2FT27_9HYME